MSAFVQQILTLVGVIVGAGASFTASTLTERARWRRTQSTRWDDRRLAAYTEYANAVKTTVKLCHRIATAQGLVPAGQPLDREAALDALADAETERTEKWETVLLLGDPDTVTAARTWHSRVWQLELVIRGQHDSEDFSTVYRDSFRLRNEFYARARTDLGVHGALPAPTFGALKLRDADEEHTATEPVPTPAPAR
jgi:hypothetical protein